MQSVMKECEEEDKNFDKEAVDVHTTAVVKYRVLLGLLISVKMSLFILLRQI